MTILGGATGAFVGFLIPVSVNALSKKRALHRPWFHVLFGGICAYAGYKYPVYKKELLDSVNSERIIMGLPPIQRSNKN